MFVDVGLVGESFDRCVEIGIGACDPFILAESEVGLVEIGIHIAHPDEKFHGRSHSQALDLRDLARMVECNLGIGVGMGAQIAYIIGFVGHPFFGEREERAGNADRHVGHGVDAYCVVATECFEAGIEDVEAQVGLHPVVVMEFAHCLLYADAGIGEEHGASVEIVNHRRCVEVAPHGHVDIAQSGESHIVAVGSECRVHLAAVGIVVEEIARIGVLRRSGSHGHEADEYGYGFLVCCIHFGNAADG